MNEDNIPYRIKATTTIVATNEVKEVEYADVVKFYENLQLNIALAEELLHMQLVVQPPTFNGDNLHVVVSHKSSNEPYMTIEAQRYLIN